MKQVITAVLLLLSATAIGQPTISLQPFASGFDQPVDIAHADDDRLFIVEQGGTIMVSDIFGNVKTTPFLDISANVNSSGTEQGLLGLAFHPDYSQNGYFYVHYTGGAGSGVSYISRFSVSGNPHIADASSEVVIYSLDQPNSNHNGGDLAFGPDGYLYIGFGDGGGANDPNNNAQNPQNILGKMIRLDVDGASPYAIPASNPFVGDTSTLDEIWQSGLRNPWRFSFDALTGDMWIGDVGQLEVEEVNFQPAASNGGENWGWRCYEGDSTFNTTGCGSPSNYEFPVSSYTHAGGNCAITGGCVYRGSAFPSLNGYYIYVDFCSGTFRYVVDNGGWQTGTLLSSSKFGFSAFGEDWTNELYVANRSDGMVYRIKGSETVKLDIKVYLQGPYDQNTGLMRDDLRSLGLLDGNDPYGFGATADNNVFSPTGNDAIVDWVFVELRDALDPATIVEQIAALVQRDGDVVAIDGIAPLTILRPPGNYHVSVGHRNHLGAMSAAPIQLYATPTSIDFSAISTYGTNAQYDIAGTKVLWAGDVTDDGVVSYTGLNNDRDPLLVEIGGTVPTNITSGYLYEDVNMDGEVKYTGLNNDRDPILVNIGGLVPTNTREAQLP